MFFMDFMMFEKNDDELGLKVIKIYLKINININQIQFNILWKVVQIGFKVLGKFCIYLWEI